MLNFSLPRDVSFILDTLEATGFSAFIVGGCVRDFIMGKTPHDFDITTSAYPENVKSLFKRTYDTGIKHGTVTVVIKNARYEITTYRIDGNYGDFRRPDSVTFTSDLKEDLLRRDFTMNAIAYNPKSGIFDPFSGLSDIKNKVIKGVGDPYKRFSEDALRILRAVRFSACLGFDIEEKTLDAIGKTAYLIPNVSPERIREELLKALSGNYKERLSLLWEKDLLSVIYPPLARHFPLYGEKLIALLKKSKDLIISLALFLEPLSVKETKDFLLALRFDNKTISDVMALANNKDFTPPSVDYDIKKTLNALGEPALRRLYALAEIKGMPESKASLSAMENILTRGDCVFLSELDITGNDIIKMGVPKGKEIGKILSLLLDAVHKNPEVNERSKLKKLTEEILSSNIK